MSKREGSEIERSMKERMSGWVSQVMPQDQRAFEAVIDRVRGEIGEWLWKNVLTKRDVIRAIESLWVFFSLRSDHLHGNPSLKPSFISPVVTSISCEMAS